MPDGRGSKSTELKNKNIKKISDWLKKNPCGLKTDCAKDLKLSYPTVLNHIKALEK